MHAANKKIKKIYILFIFCSLNLQGIFAEGLRFFGNSYPIDQRTSYNVFSEHPIIFSSHYKIGFDLYLYLTSGIGSIVRIKTEDDKRTFNLFYDGYGNDHLFLLNEEGKSNLIRIALDQSAYPPFQWYAITIDFDLIGDTITLAIADKVVTIGSISLLDTSTPVIVFGKSDHIIDVPFFAIRNLSVGNGKEYRFPLNEYQGNVVHDIRGRKIGSVTNPDWLINDSYHWKQEAEFKTPTVSGSNYHERRKEIYYFNRDSMLIFNLKTKTTDTVVFKTPCPVDLRLGTNFLDTINDRLYCYEVYRDESYQGPMVASLDLHSFEWRIESFDRLPTQLHHHGAWSNDSAGQYVIFGGFGNLHFCNQFYRYNIETKQWSKLPVNNKGEITPRYFTSMGYHKEKHQLYLFGGTGNVSGDQLLGREYYYDLYRLDLKDGLLTKEWEIPWDKDNVVPVKGMVINDESSFYTLCYPEHFTESFLKLYRFSIEDGHYTVLGDSIPIFSDRINTNANLYYDKELNTLYAVIHQFDDDIKSDLHIYSLAFPPITEKDLANYPPTAKKSNAGIIYLIMGMVVLSAGIILYRLGRNKRQGSHIFDIGSNINKSNQKRKVHLKANSIYLFGEFTVRNRYNRDITYLFSKKLKETFCLLLQYSQEKEGITSQHLSRLLWPEKQLQDVKNIRNVTLNRLRKILEELDGIELLFEKGMFTIMQQNPIYCDYTRCMQILSGNQWEAEYKELIDIVTRGKFLEDEDNPFYDILKEKTEKRIEPLIIRAMEESYDKEGWQTTIDLAQAAFHIDPMNDTALNYMIKAMQKLGMHEGAKIKYLSFLIEYKKVMGKDYLNPMKL